MLAALTALLAADLPSVGADGWTFAAGHVHRRVAGVAGRAARGGWDINLLRTTVVATMALVTLGGLLVLRGWRPGRRTLVVITMAAVAGVLLPPVLLQMGLRQSTAPWFYTNDSTYQIELAGKVARMATRRTATRTRTPGWSTSTPSTGRVAHRPDGRTPPLPVLPRLGRRSRGVVGRAPRAVARLPAVRRPLHPAAGARGAALPRPARLSSGHRRGARLNPVALRLAWFGNADAPSYLRS